MQHTQSLHAQSPHPENAQSPHAPLLHHEGDWKATLIAQLDHDYHRRQVRCVSGCCSVGLVLLAVGICLIAALGAPEGTPLCNAGVALIVLGGAGVAGGCMFCDSVAYRQSYPFEPGTWLKANGEWVIRKDDYEKAHPTYLRGKA